MRTTGENLPPHTRPSLCTTSRPMMAHLSLRQCRLARMCTLVHSIAVCYTILSLRLPVCSLMLG